MVAAAQVIVDCATEALNVGREVGHPISHANEVLHNGAYTFKLILVGVTDALGTTKVNTGEGIVLASELYPTWLSTTVIP